MDGYDVDSVCHWPSELQMRLVMCLKLIVNVDFPRKISGSSR